MPSGNINKYAMFLMDREFHLIDESMIYQVQAAALAIGAILERKVFQEQAIFVQRTALLGHLTRGLVHEINHQISPLNFAIGNLQNSLERIKTQDNIGEKIDLEILDAVGNLDDMRKSVRAITNTARQFGRILTQPRNEILRIDELVLESFDLLRDTADRDNIKLILVEPDELLLLRSQGAALEQVLINVMLNALQQIKEFRGRAGGWVQVRIETDGEAQEGERYRILIQDNGPGIHIRQWEQVFEVGFTTRDDGGGMGLYISRSLMDAIGGLLCIEESYILSGSVFAIELPSNM